jgi:RimJ/RimL family protein N-acetyltransferase
MRSATTSFPGNGFSRGATPSAPRCDHDAVISIETPRLVLEPLVEAHAEEMATVLADPALYAVIGGAPPTVDELRERYRIQMVGRSRDGRESWHNWIVRSLGDGRAVGYVQATVTGGAADVAWVIGTPWQGSGFATEAGRAMVDWLASSGVRVVTAHIAEGHGASERVAERLGLVLTDELEDGERIWRVRLDA